MKKTYTILAPNMLPMHFRMIAEILQGYGYKMEILQTTGRRIAETGLKYTHNDTCYPAILVVGQFIDALQSGKYDPKKTALVMFQTGGGCRASNYISLICKALQKAGYGYVPVISMSLAGIEKHPGWKLTLPMYLRMAFGILYADLLMDLSNQCRPYELRSGSADELAQRWIERLCREMSQARPSYRQLQDNYRAILQSFAALPMDRSRDVVPVCVVGEIFVKYAPLGNNNLNDFLQREGAEVVVPGLLGFCLYSIYDGVMDYKLYGVRRGKSFFCSLAYRFLLRRQKELIRLMEENGVFRPQTPFDHTVSLIQGYIGIGTQMGEGWLLTAEMLELLENGVQNIVCTQPFGCLPNHICGKGMPKPIKLKNPDANIIAIDYDAGASEVNQENRIKLMLANARQKKQAARAAV